MIVAQQVGAIAPGWFILALLVGLALAIVWAFVEGKDAEEQLDRILEEPEEPMTVQVWTILYDWENEREGGVR
jgi:hypothetical protein